MDFAFFRRAQRLLDSGAPAELDYRVMVATLAALQSTSATARAAALGAGGGPGAVAGRHPLAEILTDGAGWRDAVAAQGGCFNLRQAQCVKPSSTQMTVPFTTAF
jgi:hypothetical protein